MRVCRFAFAALLLVFATAGPRSTQAQGQGQGQAADLVRLMQQITAFTKDGKLAEAAEAGRQLVAVAEKVAGKDNVLTATTLFALGQVYQMQGKLDEAVETFNRVRAIREKALGPDHAEVADPLDRLGGIATTR